MKWIVLGVKNNRTLKEMKKKKKKKLFPQYIACLFHNHKILKYWGLRIYQVQDRKIDFHKMKSWLKKMSKIKKIG